MRSVPLTLRWILGGLLVFEILYVAAGVILVQSGQVDRWLNHKPEKRTITFDSAWSFVPGVARVSGVRVVRQGRGSQLEVVVDRARGFVGPLEDTPGVDVRLALVFSDTRDLKVLRVGTWYK